jgi:hypothetical protein
MRFEQQRAGCNSRINSYLPPPCDFIAASVDFSMVSSTQGDGELIAHPSAEYPALRKAQVMGICGLMPTN